MKRLLPKEVETLWTLFTAPTVWAFHFIVCYVVVAIYCEKALVWSIDFNAIRIGLGIFTLMALAMILLSAYLAWRQWGFGSGDPPHSQATDQDRRLFQGFATLLLSGLSFVAVVYVAIPLIFIAGCQI
ncbi:phage shock protein PspC (stress-responsive transcriptional regulator) [Pseudorhizobium tarimense]|uniref:Phage shock protein PspC (Stress-responsive transcriptional regulator) n=1 Tax=Pseudorhizobium tarimense TaxID=1079109 RepID=A0ABV2H9Z0_9HYPH|nr:hypothetical protein [Pseudorhizobium tarimense]MCJ8520139.1 hypothetical protein [Pseudorhizobium tarimense]